MTVTCNPVVFIDYTVLCYACTFIIFCSPVIHNALVFLMFTCCWLGSCSVVEWYFSLVRLNLINHLVGFIPGLFACNSALKNPVFRWESCKDNVCESVKKCSRMCTEARTHDWMSRMAHDWQAARWCSRVKHAKDLNRHASYSNTGQNI